MPDQEIGQNYTINHPRRRLSRALVRFLGRVILPLAFRVKIAGRDNFPQGGPLLVVANHRAVMEAVLLAVYTPWQIEALGASDVPHEDFVQLALDIYGYIPVNRGHFDRQALEKALDVLRQDGVVTIFPEGGIWNAGRMRAQTGVAWLSYRANAPVLPIGFAGTVGALRNALQLKRPPLTMHVGQVRPAARLPDNKPRKTYLQEYAARTVETIEALLPADDRVEHPAVQDERFELQISTQTADGKEASYPDDLTIQHAAALAELLHRPPVLKIFTSNLNLPTRPLEQLDQEPDLESIVEAAQSILEYLRKDNPYLLTYRFGASRAEAMRLGLEELLNLARWASKEGLRLRLIPIRRYISPESGEEIAQTRQGSFQGWM